MVNRPRNARGRFTATPPIDVRSESQIPKLEAMIHSGPLTFVLVYADWCGHCHRYLPMWKELEKTPGRTANIARVHHDMMNKAPTIANAKIQGYPSVIKVKPTGEIEEYTDPSSAERTNAIPDMRNMDMMKKELAQPVKANMPKNNVSRKNNNFATPVVKHVSPNRMANGMPPVIPVSNIITKPAVIVKKPGVQEPNNILHADKIADANVRMMQQGGAQRGGAMESVLSAFVSAVQQVGPAAALLLASDALTRRRARTFKSPKRSTRGGTRRNRKF